MTLTVCFVVSANGQGCVSRAPAEWTCLPCPVSALRQAWLMFSQISLATALDIGNYVFFDRGGMLLTGNYSEVLWSGSRLPW